MAKNKLTAIKVKNAGDGKLFDGAGLMLVKKAGAGKWVYRYSHLEKRREMGLGTYPILSLSEARELRDQWESALAKGNDPIELRKAQQKAEAAERDKFDPTFADAVELVFEAIKATLRGGGTRGRWKSPLTTHVIPRIGKRRLSELHQTDIHAALSSIWKTKHPTALKAINRISIVLRESETMGYQCDPDIVRRAKALLGKHKHVTVPTPSTPWRDVPAVFAKLDRATSVDRLLRFMILALPRYDACAGLGVSEMDNGIWTVPAERVKGTEENVKAFRVPISYAMQEIIDLQMEFCDDLLFPSYTGRPVTANALEERLNTLGEAGRPHGFRASFRTWASETDACGWEVSETILGHTIGNKVERAYDRSELLERRLVAMNAWADHVTGVASGKVLSISG